MDAPTAKALSDVKDAIERIRGDLPATSNDPVVNSIDIEGQAILTHMLWAAPQKTIE